MIRSTTANEDDWRGALADAARPGRPLVLALLLTGCAVNTGLEDPNAELVSRVQALEYQVLATQVAVQELTEDQQSGQADLSRQLTDLNSELGRVPEAVGAVCANPETTPVTACESDQLIRTVVMSGDKMVVGEMERVWLEPPGASLIARVDTGAHSSSLHAENLVEFERDGEDWVRFDLILDEEIKTLERRVVRYVRVYQQADPEGSRRPVVNMRLRLGDVHDSFEFTLADRSHLDFQLLLGRNFLTDMALVDVGKQFVQSPYHPSSPAR
ncbi:MAG: hypothetical protein GTN56_07250 [Xanthomonadales bacterium]|nr:hypothetical protein [Xanthomonadales bacterium]NIP16201.1 hypothetical protein [Pseudomonadales bacterium]NIN74996.1 hypothetical protein [Xanthomonadales bacterium]NIO12684.1 hypothetical protein [Xanthomonadales bacterium]NIP11985.1 hypothetical protein [Xanthomonadales bacterium]